METRNYTNDAITLLKELIAIPSISRNETAAADKLAESLNNWGMPSGREGNNLWVGCQDWDDNRKTVMLNAHIDTVRPVNTWTRDPFIPTQEGDQIFGLGANDCGLMSSTETFRIRMRRIWMRQERSIRRRQLQRSKQRAMKRLRRKRSRQLKRLQRMRRNPRRKRGTCSRSQETHHSRSIRRREKSRCTLRNHNRRRI